MTGPNSGSPTPPFTPPSEDEFRQAMGRFATGVVVVSTRSGRLDHAITVNSFTSVSLDPMLVLTCVDTDSRFHDAVADAGVFGVSVLAEAQRPAASWLATPGRPIPGQFDHVPHERGAATGVVLLAGSLTTIECRTEAIHPAGDHSIVIGNVLSLSMPANSQPALTYFRGRYGALP